MLEEVEAEQTRARLHRLSYADARIRDVLAAMGITDESVTEILEMLDQRGLGDSAVGHLDRPFAQPLVFRPFGGRFGDGTYPVFYSALDRATAIEEATHQAAVHAAASAGARAYYQAIECEYSGLTFDLVPHVEAMPFLNEPDRASYPQCQAVAREAIGRDADALFSPSARRREGVCSPVFERGALRDPALSNAYAIEPDGAGGFRAIAA